MASVYSEFILCKKVLINLLIYLRFSVSAANPILNDLLINEPSGLTDEKNQELGFAYIRLRR